MVSGESEVIVWPIVYGSYDPIARTSTRSTPSAPAALMASGSVGPGRCGSFAYLASFHVPSTCVESDAPAHAATSVTPMEIAKALRVRRAMERSGFGMVYDISARFYRIYRQNLPQN